MAAEPRLSDANLEALCGILRDTGTGLTGSEIGRFLRECDVDDPCGRSPSSTTRCIRPAIGTGRTFSCARCWSRCL